MRHELHRHRSALLDLDAVLLRSEYQTGIARRGSPVGVKIDLEAVRVIQRRNLQLHFGALLHMDGRRIELILLGRHVNRLHILVRLQSARWTRCICTHAQNARSGKTSGDAKPASQTSSQKPSCYSHFDFSFREDFKLRRLLSLYIYSRVATLSRCFPSLRSASLSVFLTPI